LPSKEKVTAQKSWENNHVIESVKRRITSSRRNNYSVLGSMQDFERINQRINGRVRKSFYFRHFRATSVNNRFVLATGESRISSIFFSHSKIASFFG
jgi:hypothetical protein